MNYLIKPWEHQLKAIGIAQARDYFALFFEMGAGKTGTVINILRHKYNAEKRVFNTLILCPLITLENWRREWGMHSKVPSDQICVLEGSGAKRLKTFSQTKAKIVILNYEALLTAPLFHALHVWGPRALVCDESHKLKDYKAKRTKAVLVLAQKAQYRYLLTGTPVLNSPMDLFSQFLVMDRGSTFGKNFFFFRAEYFFDKNVGMRGKQNYFPDWRIKPGSLDHMNRLIQTSSMRIKKEECLDLPPLVRQTIYCELTPYQTKAYREMEKHFITYLNDKACVAELALTKGLRLLQIVSGFAKLEDGVDTAFEATPKMLALQELLEMLTPQHKVLVWAVFRENYAQIREVLTRLGLRFVEVHGEVDAKDRFAAVDQFTRDPETRVFLGNPGSGGIGINLTCAAYSIFYSRNFSLEHDLQAEARNHRGGSEIHEKITRIDLVAKNTLDELVVEALAKKQAIGEEILKEWRGRL